MCIRDSATRRVPIAAMRRHPMVDRRRRCACHRASVEQAGLPRARHQLSAQPRRIVQALAGVVVQQTDEGQHFLHRHAQALQVGHAHVSYTHLDVYKRQMLDYPGWRGVDYVVLLKVDGKWMIMSKSWTGTLTQKPA